MPTPLRPVAGADAGAVVSAAAEPPAAAGRSYTPEPEGSGADAGSYYPAAEGWLGGAGAAADAATGEYEVEGLLQQGDPALQHGWALVEYRGEELVLRCACALLWPPALLG